MKINRLDEMVRGWFVGGFEPNVYETTDVEIAIQQFNAGDKEPSHCHKIATEITVIVSGRAEMKGNVYEAGRIITISPGEYTDFHALEDTVTAVVKIPGALNDKYLEEGLSSC
jgi:mannose-6-phosphate isomerase-like protein (cupin superfamily)